MTHDHDHSHGRHGHSHEGHGHHHAPANFDRAFMIGIALNAGFVAAEAAFGYAANSLALLADAAHNLGDVLGLCVAWTAALLMRRRPTARRTYGYGRSSILASLANAVVLLISVGGIALEAVQRFSEQPTVASGAVIWVAAVGIAINGATALMFMSGSKGDLNLRGAFLHMATDALVSAGVVVAAVVIGFTGWFWIDPAVSLVIAAVITVGTWGLLRQSVDLAMDAVPAGIDRDAVEAHLRAQPGVVEVHDLHIWALSTTDTALTAHLVRPADYASDHKADGLIPALAASLKSRFGIGHATIQIETADQSAHCALAAPETV